MTSRVGDRPSRFPQDSTCVVQPLMHDSPSISDRRSLSTNPSVIEQGPQGCSCQCSCFCPRQTRQRRRSPCCSRKCIIIALVFSILANLIPGGAILYHYFRRNYIPKQPEVPLPLVANSLLCLGRPRETTLKLPEALRSNHWSNSTCRESAWMHDLAAEMILSNSCDNTGKKETTIPPGTDRPSALLFLQPSPFSESPLPWREYFSSMRLSHNSPVTDTPGRYLVISVVAHADRQDAYRSHSLTRRKKDGTFQTVLMTKSTQRPGSPWGSRRSGVRGDETILVGVLALEIGDSLHVNVSDATSVCRNSYRSFLGVWKM